MGFFEDDRIRRKNLIYTNKQKVEEQKDIKIALDDVSFVDVVAALKDNGFNVVLEKGTNIIKISK